MARNEHSMEDIFREAFADHELDVNPKVWSGLESALGDVGAVGGSSTGSAFLAKAAAAIGFAGLITAATIAEINYQGSSETQESRLEVVDAEASEVEEAATVDHAVLNEKGQNEHDDSESMSSNEQALPNAEQQSVEGTSSVISEIGIEEEAKASQNAISSEVAGTEERAPAPTRPKNDAASPSQPSDDSAEPSPQPTVDEPEEEEERLESTTAYFTHDAKQFITPNGDGINDFLLIEGYGVDQFAIQIMTQAGQTVFESKRMDVRWNGVDRFGNVLPNGVYFFEIRAIGTDGLPYVAKNARGSVTIRR